MLYPNFAPLGLHTSRPTFFFLPLPKSDHLLLLHYHDEGPIRSHFLQIAFVRDSELQHIVIGQLKFLIHLSICTRLILFLSLLPSFISFFSLLEPVQPFVFCYYISPIPTVASSSTNPYVSDTTTRRPALSRYLPLGN